MSNEQNKDEDARFVALHDAYLQTQIHIEQELARFHRIVLNELPTDRASPLLEEFASFRLSVKYVVRQAFIKLKTLMGLSGELFNDLETWISSPVGWTFKQERHPCEICGEGRTADIAHIIPRSRGGSGGRGNTFFLCPTHHALFDRHQLSKEEWDKLNFSNKSPAACDYAMLVICPRLEKYWNGEYKYQ